MDRGAHSAASWLFRCSRRVAAALLHHLRLLLLLLQLVGDTHTTGLQAAVSYIVQELALGQPVGRQRYIDNWNWSGWVPADRFDSDMMHRLSLYFLPHIYR